VKTIRRVFDNESMPLNLKSHYIHFKDNLKNESDTDVELMFTYKILGINCIEFEVLLPYIYVSPGKLNLRQ
jgi:hypothetical protein